MSNLELLPQLKSTLRVRKPNKNRKDKSLPLMTPSEIEYQIYEG